MKVTFLSGYRPMAKTFKKDGVDAYPRIKKMSSHSYEIPKTVDGLREKAKLLRQHAEHGHCLLKGSLTREIEKESRSGLTDNDKLTENVVFDIDGVRFPDLEPQPPVDKAQLQRLAEACVAVLPDEFRNASYIVHASSSLGMKPGLVSLHLEFWLDKPVTPTLLKQYLTKLNFDIDLFRASLELTATGSALRYKLDRTLADNSRLIYIGKPVFEDGLEDPVEDRILLVEKPNLTANVYEELMKIKPTAVNGMVAKHVGALREQNGWAPSKEKGHTILIDGKPVFVVTNPDHMTMEFAYAKKDWVYYNINGGDSNAYYVHRDNPAVVHNFKGEPAFMFEQANSEMYQWHLEEFGLGYTDEDEENEPSYQSRRLVPVVIDEKRSDASYRGYYDPVKKIFTQLDATRSKEKLQAWMNQHNALMPDELPVWEFYFDPTSDKTTDFKTRRANTFERTDLLDACIELPGELAGLKYGQAHKVQEVCPTIYKIIWSMTGASALEFEHFMNWLCVVVMTRNKTMTAWAMSGTPGTGKGFFTNYIANPILGPAHAFALTERSLADDFNAWKERAILVTVDEFTLRKSRAADRMMLMLKNAITEPTAEIRAMRQDVRMVPNFANFLFFSNDYGMLKIEEGDRRFNVCPRQEVKLIDRFPELDTENLLDMVNDELPAFVSFLRAFDFNLRAAQKCLENDAKQALHRSAASIEEQFFEAIHKANLDFFTIVFEENVLSGNDMFLPAAQNIVQQWIQRGLTGEEPMAISSKDLAVVYSAIMGRGESALSFGKRLGRNGLEPERVTIKMGSHTQRQRGRYVGWRQTREQLEEMKLAYIPENQTTYTVGAT